MSQNLTNPMKDYELKDFLKQNHQYFSTSSYSLAKYIVKKPQNKTFLQVNDNLLVYVVEGVKILHFENHTVEIYPNELIFLKSGSYIMEEVLDKEYKAFIFFYPDILLVDFVKKYNISLSRCDDNTEFFSLQNSNINEYDILSCIPYFKSQESNKELLVKLKLEELFLKILLSSDAIKLKNFLSVIYSQYDKDNIFRYELENSLEEFDTVKDMAKKFKLNEKNFREKFKKIFSILPKQWLLSKKLEQAKFLIQTSDKNITQIARQTGFNSISWFTQAFKKRYNTTPKKLKDIHIH